MADPRRYFIDPELNEDGTEAKLHIFDSPSGEWIKWPDFVDYKNGQRANRAEQSVTRLGLEVVALRLRLQAMEKAGNKLSKMLARVARSRGADADETGPIADAIKDWIDAQREGDVGQ